jgi:hypothetical protein
MDQLCHETVPELNTKKLGNSRSFLTITHTTLFANQFMSYRIFNDRRCCRIPLLDRTAAKQISTFRLRFAENLEVLNTELVGNSLSFPMIHQTAPKS